MQTAAQRFKARVRAKAKGRKPKPRSNYNASGVITRNVIIPDIDHGAWSFIGQPTAPDSGIPDFLT